MALPFVRTLRNDSTGGHVTAEQDYKWRESQVYIETMSRRIRDVIGLQVGDEEVNGVTV